MAKKNNMELKFNWFDEKLIDFEYKLFKGQHFFSNEWFIEWEKTQEFFKSACPGMSLRSEGCSLVLNTPL